MISIRLTVRLETIRVLCCYAIVLFYSSNAPAADYLGDAVCGDLKPPGQFGPFDYRTAPAEARHLVEPYHFTADVESGKKGNTDETAGHDLDFTLRAFPNSPRALMTVVRYVQIMKSDRPHGFRFPAECYYQRAFRMAPDDPMPHLIYAIYLKQHKRMADALGELDRAEELRGEPSNFDLDYNLGLLYFDAGAYDKSLEAAKRAYALGAPLPALQNKLKKAGKWRD